MLSNTAPILRSAKSSAARAFSASCSVWRRLAAVEATKRAFWRATVENQMARAISRPARMPAISKASSSRASQPWMGSAQSLIVSASP